MDVRIQLFFQFLHHSTYKDRKVLEAIRIAPILAHRILVPQHKRNLNNSCQARAHQRIPKHSMHHGAERQVLRMA